MERGKISSVTLIFSIMVFLIDLYFFTAYSNEAALTVGWGYVAGAALTQCLVLLTIVLIRAKWGRLFRQDETTWPLDSLRKIAVFLVLVFVGMSLSIALLQVGIVCPEEGFPGSRGKPMCELTRAERHAASKWMSVSGRQLSYTE